MKRFPGKIVMVVIILSCGFVMQAEQSEKAHLKQATPHLLPSEARADLAAQRRVALPDQHDSW